MSPDLNPLVLVSVDTHVGPRLIEDLRPYCETRYLDEFDAFAAHTSQELPPMERQFREAVLWNARSKGHYDSAERARDMDRDGIAAEVIFHGSQNFVPLPFDNRNWFGDISISPKDLDLAQAGKRIFNRWLADFCAELPGRRVGLAQVPMWDIAASIAEVEWAADAGLAGVNFPSADAPGVQPLDDPDFEGFWAACAALEMPLVTHISPAPPFHRYTKAPYGGALGVLDAGWWGRRSIAIMTYSGVFERHPGLRLVPTEIPGGWYREMTATLESMYFHMQTRTLREFLPHPPSHYFKQNIWFGCSFQSRQEAEEAIEEGYADRAMWGSDYPHAEGTWCYADPGSDETPMTQLSLQSTYAGLPTSDVRAMVGLNAIDCFSRLDDSLLHRTAEAINAPTATALLTHTGPGPAARPANMEISLGFRKIGAWS